MVTSMLTGFMRPRSTSASLRHACACTRTFTTVLACLTGDSAERRHFGAFRCGHPALGSADCARVCAGDTETPTVPPRDRVLTVMVKLALARVGVVGVAWVALRTRLEPAEVPDRAEVPGCRVVPPPSTALALPAPATPAATVVEQPRG